MRPALLILPLLLATPVLAQDDVDARLTGEIVDQAGDNIGSVSIFETLSGVVRVNVQATGISAGGHGVHIHEAGICEGDFTSAGGHLAKGMAHGLVDGGPHPGDLPNGFVQEDGVLSMEAFNDRLDFGDMEDGDGAALIIHSDPDDYESQPSGDAGSRVACAVLKAPT